MAAGAGEADLRGADGEAMGVATTMLAAMVATVRVAMPTAAGARGALALLAAVPFVVATAGAEGGGLAMGR